jgi:hypothetical protein
VVWTSLTRFVRCNGSTTFGGRIWSLMLCISTFASFWRFHCLVGQMDCQYLTSYFQLPCGYSLGCLSTVFNARDTDRLKLYALHYCKYQTLDSMVKICNCLGASTDIIFYTSWHMISQLEEQHGNFLRFMFALLWVYNIWEKTGSLAKSILVRGKLLLISFVASSRLFCEDRLCYSGDDFKN